MSSPQEIIQYYDECECHYRWFWNLNRSLAMHAGFWDASTRTLEAALCKENETLAQKAHIRASDQVLDAGCGVGGSSIYLANTYQCHVTGITLSEHQKKTATQFAKQRAPQQCLPQFHVMDFCKTSFADKSFDVVWAIESICHAPCKKAFIKEAYRLLKPNGRLIIADAFLCKENYSPSEELIMKKWLNGWGVDSLDHQYHFLTTLREAGFQQVNFEDRTSSVMPSSKRLYRVSLPALALTKVTEWLHLSTPFQTANLKSAYYQYKALQNGLWRYGIFYGEKEPVYVT